jgi:hypothetical protein
VVRVFEDVARSRGRLKRAEEKDRAGEGESAVRVREGRVKGKSLLVAFLSGNRQTGLPC